LDLGRIKPPTEESVEYAAMDTVNRSNTFVQSVDRAISVMEFLSRRGWSGVTEVANELNIHKSTAYRLLTTLRDRGLVEQDAATEKYRLGFGLVLLASAVRADLDILRCARPICERLSEQTRETVTVAVLEGDDAVVIHQNISRSSAVSVDWTGRHTPLHATAAGKVFLAHMPDDQRRRILRRQLERFTENTIADPATLRNHIQAIRGEGYGYTVEELEGGLNAIGAPIRCADGAVVGVISVSGPAFRLSTESIPEVAELVVGAAAEISRCLGFHATATNGRR
jgi:DNA-binding IclR family transcriptional regulator